MTPQRIEEVMVAGASVAAGAMLLIDRKYVPRAFQSLWSRLGKYRRAVGIVAIVCGLSLALLDS